MRNIAHPYLTLMIVGTVTARTVLTVTVAAGAATVLFVVMLRFGVECKN